MGLEPGTIVIIAAVLIFYLRLILLQRQRAKQVRQASESASLARNKKKGRPTAQPPVAPPLTVISHRRRDWMIAGFGAVLILIGIGLNRLLIPAPALQAYWWLPIALGIVAFSWAFR